jgi:hypothetical protein
MTEKARTGKLYIEVEGDKLMETAPDDMMKKGINKEDERIDEIEDNREMTKGDDARMMDNKEEEFSSNGSSKRLLIARQWQNNRA